MALLLVRNPRESSDRRHRLLEEKTLVGRGEHCDVRLDSAYVSREHLKLFKHNGSWTLESQGLNGTLLNDRLLPTMKPVELHDGDQIRIGDLNAVFAEESGDRAEAAADDPKARFFALEKAVHSNLLTRLDLRRFAVETAALEEHADQILDALTTVVLESIAGLDERLRQWAVREAVKREMAGKLLHTSATTRIRTLLAQRRTRADRENEQSLQEMLATLQQRLGLTGRPDKLSPELESLETSFDTEFTASRYRLTAGLEDYLFSKILTQDIADLVFGLGPLQDLIDMTNISEIMVVSKDLIYVERGGILQRVDRSFISDNVVMSIIERIVTPLGRRIDKSTPLVDARLADGSRVNAIIPPLALKGPCITIRKFSKTPLTIDDLIEKKAMSKRAATFLRATVMGAKNVVISGGTGSGKTTLLNVLSSFIPHRERVVTIEDSAELQLMQEHVVSLETRPANIEGKGAYAIRDLVKNALRMRPDRIVVGECRGGETLDMLQAMNTGHSGSMTTAHANSPREMISRLETMALMAGMDLPLRALREQIVGAVDVVVQQTRLHTGARRVTEIAEVTGIDEQSGEVLLEPIFVYQTREDGTEDLSPTGYIPSFITDLLEKQIITLEEFF